MFSCLFCYLSTDLTFATVFVGSVPNLCFGCFPPRCHRVTFSFWVRIRSPVPPLGGTASPPSFQHRVRHDCERNHPGPAALPRVRPTPSEADRRSDHWPCSYNVSVCFHREAVMISSASFPSLSQWPVRAKRFPEEDSLPGDLCVPSAPEHPFRSTRSSRPPWTGVGRHGPAWAPTSPSGLRRCGRSGELSSLVLLPALTPWALSYLGSPWSLWGGGLRYRGRGRGDC